MINKKMLKIIELHLQDLVETNQIPHDALNDAIFAIYRLTTTPLPDTLLPYKLLLVEEAAGILRVSQKTIYDYFNSGELRRIRLGYRATRIDEKDLREFIDRRKVVHISVG